jgi:hypothetical protein
MSVYGRAETLKNLKRDNVGECQRVLAIEGGPYIN